MCIDSDKTLKYQIKHGEIPMPLPPPPPSELSMVEHLNDFGDDILSEFESEEKDKKISKRKRYHHTSSLRPLYMNMEVA